MVDANVIWLDEMRDRDRLRFRDRALHEIEQIQHFLLLYVALIEQYSNGPHNRKHLSYINVLFAPVMQEARLVRRALDVIADADYVFQSFGEGEGIWLIVDDGRGECDLHLEGFVSGPLFIARQLEFVQHCSIEWDDGSQGNLFGEPLSC